MTNKTSQKMKSLCVPMMFARDTNEVPEGFGHVYSKSLRSVYKFYGDFRHWPFSCFSPPLSLSFPLYLILVSSTIVNCVDR